MAELVSRVYPVYRHSGQSRAGGIIISRHDRMLLRKIQELQRTSIYMYVAK